MSDKKSMGERSKELAKGLFGGLKETKARVDSNWEREGHYFHRIDRIKLDLNRKKQVGFFVEKTVIHVLDNTDETGEVIGHKVGESITHAMWKHHESFLGNVKAFLAAALGLPAEVIEEDHVFEVIGDDQPLSGTVVENKNRKILTREKNNPFTVVNYIREVPPAELLEVLSKTEDGEEVKETYFPNNILEEMAAYDAEADEEDDED